MTWKPEQTPRIDPNDPYSYPDIDPRVLLHMEPSTFNQWRREFDFPRIVKYLKEKLFLFDIWQTEQNIMDEDLLFFGPARFIRKNDNPIFITESDKGNQEDKKRIFIDHKKLINFQSNPNYYGNVSILKKVIPYLDWVLKRKDKPANLSENSLMGNSGTSDAGNSSKVVYNNELRLLNLGSIYERGNIITTNRMILGSRGGWNGEAKILEFINFDHIKMQNSIWNGECYLFYSSFSNVSVVSSSLSQIHFYKANLDGLKIGDTSIYNSIFEYSEIRSSFRNTEIIERCEINSCQFNNSDFFRYYNYITVRNSYFSYNIRASRNYSNIKSLYSSTGDFYNSSKYYYLEKRSAIYERSKILSYIRENRLTFDDSNLINNSLKYVASNTSQEHESLKQTTKYYMIFIIFSLGHYTFLIKDWINYLGRGFGEKPYRILFSFIPLILFFTLFNSFMENYDSFSQLIIDNSFNMLGKFELDPNSKLNSSFRILKAAMGVFLISLFVADLSSKKRY